LAKGRAVSAAPPFANRSYILANRGDVPNPDWGLGLALKAGDLGPAAQSKR
jgi:hypothetical protein